MRNADGVRMERSNWRCAGISQRHRQWGFNCPSVDLDFVMAEYNHGAPVAVVEYKHRLAEEPNLNHPTYRALRRLADGYVNGPLPFLVAFYCSDEWWFRIIPGNQAAADFYGGYTILTEQEFVGSLYHMRKQVLTEEDKKVIERLNSTKPDQP